MDLIELFNCGLQHLALHIFSYVNLEPDIQNCRLVCVTWRDLIDSSLQIWRRRLRNVPIQLDGIPVLSRWPYFGQAYTLAMRSKDLDIVSQFTILLETFHKKKCCNLTS